MSTTMAHPKTKRLDAIPEGYTTVTPWIISHDTAGVIEFMGAAFGAEEIPDSRMLNPNGSIGHVEVKIGNAIVMLFDSPKEWPATPAFIRLFVEDADDIFKQAVKSGGKVVTKVTELFFGDKVGRIADPFGNVWWIQERLEDLSNDPAELQKRSSTPEAMKAMEYVQQSLDKELRKRAS